MAHRVHLSIRDRVPRCVRKVERMGIYSHTYGAYPIACGPVRKSCSDMRVWGGIMILFPINSMP